MGKVLVLVLALLALGACAAARDVTRFVVHSCQQKQC